jgi:hypothetical protein
VDKGYTVLRNFFSIDQITSVKSLVDRTLKRELFNDSPFFKNSNFLSSTYVRDIEWKKTIYKELDSILRKHIEDKLPNYKVVLISYIKKIPGPNSMSIQHQDPAFTDELRYNTYTLWFPLHTIEKTHNSLYVVEGSYLKYKNYIRGVNIPFPFKFEEVFNNKIYLNDLKKGDAVMYHSRMIHGSDTAEISNKERYAVGVALIEKEAPFLLYKRTNKNELCVYKMNKKNILYYTGDDFLFKGKPLTKHSNYVFKDLY